MEYNFETFLPNYLTKMRFLNCFELVPSIPLDRHPTTYGAKHFQLHTRTHTHTQTPIHKSLRYTLKDNIVNFFSDHINFTRKCAQ